MHQSYEPRMTTWITICDTCKRSDVPEVSPRADGRTDGEALAELVEAGLAAKPNPDLQTRRVSCLMGCTHGCNVAIQSEGKLSYTLGRFTPDAEAAEALTEYAALHAQSDSGQVPYRSWPEGVKGHFVTRHPPLPKAS